MYFDDMDKIGVAEFRMHNMWLHENWRLTNHSEGDMLSFQLEQIIE